MSAFSQGKVGQDLDRVFLFLDHSLDQILDTDHTNDGFLLVDNGQMSDAVIHHFLHAHFDTFVGRGGNDIGAPRRNFLDRRRRAGAAQQSHLAYIVALGYHPRHIAYIDSM
jgi:hypothetical protein